MKFIKLTESVMDVDGVEIIKIPVHVNVELVYKVMPLSYQHSSSRLFIAGDNNVHIDVREAPEEIFMMIQRGVST